MKRGWRKAANSWESRLHVTPDPVKVARLVETHGPDAALERWPWIEPRTLGYLPNRGRKMLAAA